MLIHAKSSATLKAINEQFKDKSFILYPSFELTMLTNIFYITIALLALSFSIFIHELGHFIAAKKRGLIADRFSIGFGPRLFGFNWKGTDFRISLFPFGGYVSLPQLADMGRIEGGDGSETQDLPPISYTDKMVVSIMGVVFNMIFAFLLSLILWGAGREIILSTEVNSVAEEIVNDQGVTVPGPAYAAGLLKGDQIVAIDGKAIRNWVELENVIMTGTKRDTSGNPIAEVEVIRDGETRQLTLYPVLIDVGIDSIRTIGVDPGTSLVVAEVQKSMPAFDAGLQAGDTILALDGLPVDSSAFLSVYLSKHEGGTINLSVSRNGEEIVLPIEPKIAPGEETPRFGFAYYYEVNTERVHLNPIEQIAAMIRTMEQTLVALISPKSDVKIGNMSGPIGIVHGLTYMVRYSWIDLTWFLALINVNLALLNSLPIPVLDGGHMTFATIQKLTGRPVSRRIMEFSYTVCIAILLSFMLYVSYRDILRVGLDVGIVEDTPNAPKEHPTSNVEQENVER